MDKPSREEKSPRGNCRLERRAKDLEKQAKQLQEQVVRSSGLGADMQPVPEPTVRDLSVPQAAKGPRIRKTTVPDVSKPIELDPAAEGEVIPAKEIVAATVEDVLGNEAR